MPVIPLLSEITHSRWEEICHIQVCPLRSLTPLTTIQYSPRCGACVRELRKAVVDILFHLAVEYTNEGYRFSNREF